MTSHGMTAEKLLSLRRVEALQASPCGSWVAVEVKRLSTDGSKYISDLWRVSMDPRGPAPTQLTQGTSQDRSPRFFPDGSLAFLSDRKTLADSAAEAAGKRSQIFVFPAAGGEPYPITDEPLGVRDFLIATGNGQIVALAPVLPDVAESDQRSLADDRREKGPSARLYTSSPVRYWDHWLPATRLHAIAYDAAQGSLYTRRDLTPDAGDEHREPEWDICADGTSVVITHRSQGEDGADEVALGLIDVSAGTARLLIEGSGAIFGSPRFSPDGDRIAFSRSQRFSSKCPRHGIMIATVETGDARPIAPDWDREGRPCAWSPDAQSLIACAEDSGFLPVFRVDLSSGSVIRMTATHKGGSHSGVQLVGSERLIGIRSRLHHPPEPFRLDIAPAAEPVLLANLSGFSEAEGKALADWQSMLTKTEQGESVQSFLLRPTGSSAPSPNLLCIHGGPMSSWTDGWHWRWNPLVAVSAGYAVTLPNPRGSTGFGYSFKAGIWGNVWGAQCYRDLIAVQDEIEARSDIDADRSAAMGGSFGGYMTNWIGGQTDRFKALVTHASLYDLSAFWGASDASRWFTLQLAGSPVQDDDIFCRYSPHRFVNQWKTPAFVIHGEKDYRVPIGEGLALFEALQSRGVASELLVFPDENHWILKPRNAQVWYEEVLRFLGKYLMPA